MSFTLALFAAVSTPFADLNAIDQAAAEFAGGGTVPVDRRLRLDPCGSPLALSWRTQRHDTVVVQCPDKGWRLFVPVRYTTAASFAMSQAAAQAVPAINRGDAVTISVSGEGFSVSQPGEAMDGGAVGAWIRVRTTKAGSEPMRARIVRPGLVEVPVD